MNQMMLYPIVDNKLDVRDHQLNITANPAIEVFVDYFGNRVGVFSVIKPHTELVIESVTQVITKPLTLPLDDSPAEAQWNLIKGLKDEVAFMDFLQKEHFHSSEEVKNNIRHVINYSSTPLQNALTLADYVYNNFEYKQGVTSVETPIEEVWNLKAGVCQDFAHILLVMLRIYDIPARYVSGYICPKEQGVRGEGATHAWVEAYIPDYGWLGLDPTNNCIVNDEHVRLAVGRNFSDCTPVKGSYKGSGEHTLEVSVFIENGKPRKMSEVISQPSFTYQAKNPGEAINSYRRYLEMQQQQQQ
jgi:transglutaminase-like putative cysteine protease